MFLLSACALFFSSVILPVSSDQGTAFKNLDTKLVYQNENRKNGGSGKNDKNLRSHFEKGYMEFSTPEEVEMGTSTKSTHDANHGADRFEFIHLHANFPDDRFKTISLQTNAALIFLAV